MNTRLRSPNRLEKLIQKTITKECRPRISQLWGTECQIEPPLITTNNGDGLQLVWLKTTSSRPDYYVLRVDSKLDLDADDFDPEILLQAIEEEFGNADCPYYDDDPIEFPALSTGSGYWWGTIRNFRNISLTPTRKGNK